MSVKEAISIYQDLVDSIIIQYDDGTEFETPSEDAEFLDEDILEIDVSVVTMYPSTNYCIIYLD